MLHVKVNWLVMQSTDYIDGSQDIHFQTYSSILAVIHTLTYF